nr:MAG TPA: hypothetical protein [Caudoviricetes sp.]
MLFFNTRPAFAGLFYYNLLIIIKFCLRML